MSKRIEYTAGDFIGDEGLIYLEEADPYVSPQGVKLRQAKVLCACGKPFTAMIQHIKSGAMPQCRDCTNADKSAAKIKDGGRCKSPWHRVWIAMNNRCDKHKAYEKISVCEQWQINTETGWVAYRDYCNETFGKAKKRDRSGESWLVDRIDPLGDYTPDNVQLIPKTVNAAKVATDKVGGRTSVTPLDVFGYDWVETTVGYEALSDYAEDKLK
ncbi:hypothetical protein OAH34_02835 [bacterium]|nr:hypothetical protein [bacterium]